MNDGDDAGIRLCCWCGRSRQCFWRVWTAKRNGSRHEGPVCRHCWDAKPGDDDGCRICIHRRLQQVIDIGTARLKSKKKRRPASSRPALPKHITILR